MAMGGIPPTARNLRTLNDLTALASLVLAGADPVLGGSAMPADRRDPQYQLWNEAEQAAADAAEIHAAIARVTQEHIAVAATAVCQIVEAGFNITETKRQIEYTLHDTLIDFARELEDCRA